MTKYIILIAVLSVVIYANSIGGEFISDDIPTIPRNEKIADVSTWNKTSNVIDFLIYKAAGRFNPEPYHLFNIILHMLNSILVFYFLSIFLKTLPSFFGALLFASHPIQTEAVSWISGKDYLVIAALMLSSFLLYNYAVAEIQNSPSKVDPCPTDGRRAPLAEKYKIQKLKTGDKENPKVAARRHFSVIAYLASIFLYCMALPTHWNAILYPGMLMLYDITYNGWKKNFKFWMPYLLITAGYILTNIYALSGRIDRIGAGMRTDGSWTNPIFNMAYSLFNHTKLLLWPSGLTLYHEPLSVSPRMLAVQIFLTALFLSSLPFLFKKAKPLFFAAAIYILFLGATYSPVPLSWLVAERYLYLPSVAFCMLAAFLMEKYAVTEKAREAAVIFLVMLIGAYSIRTIYRNNDWRDAESLWTATVKVSPLCPRAHNNMGDVYSTKGDYEKAALAFGRAIELNPDYADAHFNLGLAYDKMGEKEKAISYINEAIALNPALKNHLCTSEVHRWLSE